MDWKLLLCLGFSLTVHFSRFGRVATENLYWQYFQAILPLVTATLDSVNLWENHCQIFLMENNQAGENQD
jgi:hypothetical protein